MAITSYAAYATDTGAFGRILTHDSCLMTLWGVNA